MDNDNTMSSPDQRNSDDKNNLDQPGLPHASNKESNNTSESSTGPSAAEKIRGSVVASIGNSRGQPFKAATSSAAAPVAMASSAAPVNATESIRRESTVLSQLSHWSNSIDGGSNNDTGENISNGIDSDSVGGITVGDMSRLGLLGSQQSQPTWMPDDDRSSSTTIMLTSAPHPSQPQPQQPSSISLFGAVMRQFGSNKTTKTTTKSGSYSSPGSRRTAIASSININQATTKDIEGDESDKANKSSSIGTGAGAFSRLIGSPSGKSIMNLLTSFNSPFKFQSPKSRNNKETSRGAKRRLDLGSPRGKSQQEDANDFPGERVKRARLGDHENNHLHAADENIDGDDDDDEAWREVLVSQFQDSTNATGSSVKAQEEVPFLDWSLKTRIRLEWHNHDEASNTCGRQCHVDPWVTHEVTSSTAWKEAATYYEFQSIGTRPKIAEKRTKTALRRESSIESIGSGSRHALSINTVVATSTAAASTSLSSLEFAKQLVRTVRGSQVKFSRQMCMDGRSTLQPGLLLSDIPETQLQPREVSVVERQRRRQWRQAFRSLYLNYRRYSEQCSNAMNAMLDCYFYCIGEGHVVLFRIDRETTNNEFYKCNDNGDTQLSSSVPTVLISDCSSAFRQKLASCGLSASDSGHATAISSAVDPGKLQFEYLKDVTNYPFLSEMTTEGKDYPSSPSPSAKKATLMSPSTKADLEALRRAQTFGESAGADIFVKTKKSGFAQPMKEQAKEDKNKKPRAIRLSGWDQVALFSEIYLNSYGAVGEIGDEDSHARLPTLVCHHRLGPFDNCMMKRLTVFPVAEEQQTLENNAAPIATNTIDVCGVVLPSALRQLVLAASKHTVPRTLGNAKASQYLVMHTFRPKNIPRSLRGLERSLVLNQGTNYSKSDLSPCFECPNGKVLQLAVWDSTSTRNVVAFRLEPARPLSIFGSLFPK